MPLSLPVALLACAALLALDFTVRALRIHFFVLGAGYRMRFWDVFVLNAFGDAASAATPMRLGGEPARLVGLVHAGVPVAVGVPLLAVEVVGYTGVVIAAAALVGWRTAPDWWATVGPQVTAAARSAAPWLLLVLVLSAVAVLVAVRMRSAAATGDPAPRTVRSLRGLLGWPLAASVPLTLASVASRVAVLPVLAQTLPAPPPVTVLMLSSFALIYGQLFLPTPGGVGPVELAFAAGAAGDLGVVFWLWRGMVWLTPLVLGFGLAIPQYGGAAVRAALRGRAPQPVPALSRPDPDAAD